MIEKIKNWKNQKNNKALVLLSVLIGTVMVACNSSENNNLTKVDLPIIGQHDIAYADMDGYKAGDTIFHTVPDWEYLTEDSLLLSSSDVENKIWIADFFFSYCPTICVPMNQELDKITKQLEEHEEEIAFLSFTIDPKRDTPSELKEYREKFEFDAKNWHFLTGDQQETHDLAFYGFQILANKDNAAPGGFIHSSNFVLVDQNRYIRGVYDGLTEEGREQLLNDVKLLLEK
ncbi:MAG TPA: SCO family protein [Brumimicrobium sp.]|nr:SCO family protein [Brumimicrobium sp.]